MIGHIRAEIEFESIQMCTNNLAKRSLLDLWERNAAAMDGAKQVVSSGCSG